MICDYFKIQDIILYYINSSRDFKINIGAAKDEVNI